ncbi:hypothetical protein G7Y89_g6355 [Cudoniella acicularis]|uniref:RING-CH-type domain-containing protein n=1 Tax=Cudoniella acicularis TaxID=354080 RepID=A0A8H4RKL5_9HELO|nr:hypothetical protein G7Y89_g6355 [Cudoniella acicularis]
MATEHEPEVGPKKETWKWPDGLDPDLWKEEESTLRESPDGSPEQDPDSDTTPSSNLDQEQNPTPSSSQEQPASEPPNEANDGNIHNSQRHYEPRQCRICLEEVMPSYEPATEGITAYINPKPKVEYISADPSYGRLLRPCKCRGSQAYVHEKCLQDWRFADPLQRRNYHHCPTCGFSYRLERLRWSRIISSTLVQILLTLVVIIMIVFILGFVADPIISLYFEPRKILATIVEAGELGSLEFADVDFDEYNGWTEHFLKGLTSIGVLGFAKVMWTINPFSYIRTALWGGRNRRDRDDNTAIFIIIIGVIAFMFAVWSWVRHWSRRALETASERVIDVQGDDDEDHAHKE